MLWDSKVPEGHAPTSTLIPSRPRRSQRKTQAEPEKVPKASEVLGLMPTCPQGPGHTALLYTNEAEAATRSTHTIGLGHRKRNRETSAQTQTADKLERAGLSKRSTWHRPTQVHSESGWVASAGCHKHWPSSTASDKKEDGDRGRIESGSTMKT